MVGRERRDSINGCGNGQSSAHAAQGHVKVETETWNGHKKAQKSQKNWAFFCASCALLWPFSFGGDFDVSLACGRTRPRTWPTTEIIHVAIFSDPPHPCVSIKKRPHPTFLRC